MKNSADLGGCYPPLPSASVDNTLQLAWMRLSRIWRILQIKEGVIHRERRPRWITPPQDLQNSSYRTKAEFNNCFIIHTKYLLILKGVLPFHSLFFRSPNITQPCHQVFAVNGSIICSRLPFCVSGSIIFGGLYFWRHWFNMAKILSKFGEQQLVMVNYACGFNQSETGKYFGWLIIVIVKWGAWHALLPQWDLLLKVLGNIIFSILRDVLLAV